MNKYRGAIAFWGIIIIIAVVLVLLGVRKVDPGEVGVILRWGRVVEDRILDPGAHVVIPFADKVQIYDTKEDIYETRREVPEKIKEQGTYIDHAVDTNTSDGQQVNIYFTVRFRVDPTEAANIAQNIGSQEALVNKIVRTEARSWARSTPREYQAADLYSGSVTVVQDAIADKLRPIFESKGIVLDTVLIREIEFDQKYVQAIENKQIEAVKIETAQNQAEQAKFEKERRITQAEASAEEQRLQQATLGEEVLEKLLLDKWDGHYPDVVVSGGGEQFILPLPGS